LAIGVVARKAGVRPSALRYYERSGLIAAPKRSGGRRRYDATVFEVLGLIRLAQEAGFTVRETRQILSGFAAGTPAPARWQAVARKKLSEVEERIARAEEMRDMLKRLLKCHCETLGECVRRRLAAQALT
jgi:MerR family redox-sensitive transcriptional activator SoxR